MKKKIYLSIILLFTINSFLKAQIWQPVGPDPLNEPSLVTSTEPKLKVNENIPYIAFNNSNLDKASVRRYVNNKWENVGTAGFSAGRTQYIDLAFVGTIPYVAYRDDNKSKKATVQKYNSTTSTWDTVGTAGFTAGQADNICLTVINNTLYIAYIDYW